MDRSFGREAVIVLLKILRKLSWKLPTFSFYKLENIEYLSAPVIAWSQNDGKKTFSFPWKALLYHIAVCVASDKSESEFFHSPLSAFVTPPLLDILSVSPSSWSSMAFHNVFWPWSFWNFFSPGERSKESSLYFRHFPPYHIFEHFFHCSFWIPIILIGGSLSLPISVSVL